MQIDIVQRGGKFFYCLNQLLKAIKMSRKKFDKKVKSIFKIWGYSYYKKVIEEEQLYVGKDLYVSWSIFSEVKDWLFYSKNYDRYYRKKNIKEIYHDVLQVFINKSR